MVSSKLVRDIRWIRSWSDHGRVILRIGRDGEDLVADWVGHGVLRSNRAGTSSVFTTHRDARSSGSATTSWDPYVDPYLRHLQAKITLHAAGVSFGDRAVAFTGRSGAGKSTMAAALSQKERVALLADDTLALERAGSGFDVLPTEPNHRLLPDTARQLGFGATTEQQEKVETAARAALEPARLCAVVVLAVNQRASTPAIRRLTAWEAFTCITGQLFRFVLDEPEVDLLDFELVCDVVRAVPVYELARTTCLSDLGASVKLVLKQMQVPGAVE